MSGTTTEYGLDTTLYHFGEEFDFGGTAHPVYSVVPEPEPDDPDEPYVPPPAPPSYGPQGRRLQAILCESVTHEVLCELRSFRCTRWGDKHGGPGEIVGTASVHDDAWTLIGIKPRTIRGQAARFPDLKGVELWLCEDGDVVASGIFQQPATLDGNGRVELRAVGPEAVWDERTLGETEQRDFLEGRGSFTTTSLTGWIFGSGVETAWNTDSPWEGDRSLRVRSTDNNPHWIYSPAVVLRGSDGWVKHPVASAMIRSTSASPYIFVGTFVKIGGVDVRPDFTLAELGQASEDETDWQGPITSRGWLNPILVDHSVRSGFWIPSDGSWVDIDFVRIQWPTQTGSTSQIDLSQYPAIIARDFQYGEGGSPEGITTHVRSNTGVRARLAWEHQDDNPVGEAIRSVSDRVDGPDVWITPDWVQISAKRRGRDRRDLALTGHTVRRCSLTVDPGGEVDELRALTNLGTGPSRVLHGVNQPMRSNRRRIRQLTQTPPGLTYEGGRQWTRGQAEWAARIPTSAEVVVSYDEGRRYGIGDGVLAALSDGDLAWAGSVRVGARSFDPWANECTLSVGPDPVVKL